MVWMLAIFILFLCGVLLLLKALKQEAKDDKILILGFSGLFFGQAINRLFFYISDFYLEGNYQGHSYIGDFATETYLCFFYIQLGYLSFLIGIIVFFVCFELVFKKTHFLFSILNVLFIIVYIFLPLEIRRTVMYAYIGIDVLLLFIALIWLSRLSSIEFQSVSLLMMMGFSLYLIGNIMDSVYMRQLESFSGIAAALFIIAGALLAISPTFINPKYLSKSITNWILFSGFISASILLGILSILIQKKLDFFIILMILIAILIGIVLLIYSIINIIKLSKPPEVLNKKGISESRKKEFLKSFIRPEGVTEDEVSIAKEKQICLVCKNKLERDMYVCPGCSAFYCLKCSSVLSELENGCWVCSTAFDPSKPVKFEPPPEQELAEQPEIKQKKTGSS